MRPIEAWWLIEAHRPRRVAGDFTEQEAERLYQHALAVEAENECLGR